jgi:hypothetical protein
MGSKLLVMAVSAMVVGICGCGGSNSSHSGNASATPAKNAPPAGNGSPGSTGPLALSAYVVTGNEQPGYAVGDHPTYDSLSAFAKAEGFNGSDMRRLRAEGFHGAALARTAGTAGQGISYVIELGSAASAAKEAGAWLKEVLPPGAKRFKVVIPGATGFMDPNGPVGNIVFPEGRCVLVVGDIKHDGDPSAPARAGAVAIWTRTHAKPGACAARA